MAKKEMKKYEVTLSISEILAEDEEAAKRQFFEIVVEDKNFLNVTIKKDK